MALGVSVGFTHNGWRRHRYGVLLQEEKMVINGTQIMYPLELVQTNSETEKEWVAI